MTSIDIVIPFWGEPALLYAAVESVRAQTDAMWRLTVIDDCYPDESVPKYFSDLEDDRVTYLRNEKNVGITENFRRAVNLSQADYLVILGCDDMLLPNYLDVARETIAAVPSADVIQLGVQVINESGTVVLPLVDRVKQRVLAPRGQGVRVLSGEEMATSLIRGDWLYWPSLLFRRDALNAVDFRDEFPIIQDLALLMDIAFGGGTLAFNPSLAFSYRRHTESASQKTLLDGERFRGERKYYELARRIAKQKGWKRTEAVARRRLMSRLHAITQLHIALFRGTPAGLRSTVAHILAP
ncbi:glycosyltransferase family 2 protein [Microbacterium sp. B24]|uniref:glycosyltransferase family 2 protein n=1 Tax=Microbacterium sp. B24 TaxID=95616 RepID=UPI0005601576|nr:glycosyltransferase family 2 protein [Microbacterium sp. B24]